MQADTLLRESAVVSVEPAPQPAPEPLLQPANPWLWKTAAAIATLACIASLWFQLKRSDPIPPIKPSLAILTQSVGAEWKPGTPPLQTRGPVPQGKLAIQKGLLQLEFLSGVILVIEGPAELDLITPMKAVCHHGKVRATVPPQARGFTISASGMDVVDLGTEFGLSVGNDGKSEVQVITGEVRMQSDKGHNQSLFAGDSVAWNHQLPPTEIRKADLKFTDSSALKVLAATSQSEFHSQWNRTSLNTASARDTVFHYNFEPSDTASRNLQNLRPDSSGGLNGAIVGCQWTEGRWPGKRALEFKSPSDRVRISIPGTYESFTLSAWVRIEGWDRWLSSLLLTDEFKPGAIHWQLSDKGQIILGLNNGALENHFSPPVISRDDLGRWLFLTTTYDAQTRLVKHFLNGRLVSTSSVRSPYPITPGNAEIGNWSTFGESLHKCRVFNGRIDEFTLSSRALSDTEIAEAYDQGLPKA